MTKKAFAAKMNLYDQKYGKFAALFCQVPPGEYSEVIEYLNLLQALEIDFPGILSEPIEGETSGFDDLSSEALLLEKMDDYIGFVKAYLDIPVDLRSEALNVLLRLDKINTKNK